MRFRKIQWSSWWWSQKRILQSVLNSGRDAGRTVWGPKVPTLKGTEASLSCIQCFLYLVSSSINVSIFHSMAGYFLDKRINTCAHNYVANCTRCPRISQLQTHMLEEIEKRPLITWTIKILPKPCYHLQRFWHYSFAVWLEHSNVCTSLRISASLRV